jgi:hypothetical protein
VIAIKQLGALMLEPENVEMHWVDPDTLEAVLPLVGEETLVATLALQDRAETSPVTLSPVCLPYSPEFRPVEPGQGRDALAQLAEITQGRERIDISEIWGSLQRVPRSFDLTKWLLFAGMLCFLLEILQRRTGLVVVYWQQFVQAIRVRTIRAATVTERLFGKIFRSDTATVTERLYGKDMTGRDRRTESDAVPDETDDSSKKLSWWSRRRISREPDAALLLAKNRAGDRTDDGLTLGQHQQPSQGATTTNTVPSKDKSQDDSGGRESMFDALAKARRAAKDRTKE